MPLVLVKRDPMEVDDRLLAELRDKLPGIVADALTISDPRGRLVPNNINIWVFENNLRDFGDKVLQIIIFATEYPLRLELLDIKGEQIKQALKAIMPERLEGKSSVYIRLAPSFFDEF